MHLIKLWGMQAQTVPVVYGYGLTKSGDTGTTVAVASRTGTLLQRPCRCTAQEEPTRYRLWGIVRVTIKRLIGFSKACELRDPKAHGRPAHRGPARNLVECPFLRHRP